MNLFRVTIHEFIIWKSKDVRKFNGEGLPIFRSIDYLARGTSRQQEAYRIWKELQIGDILKSFDPILVGTIPLDVDIPESDLDIICEVHQSERFESVIVEAFSGLPGFQYSSKVVQGLPRYVAAFSGGDFPIEIFGQPIPTLRQNGYRHLCIEYRILKHLGEEAKIAIRNLKKSGLKTEPAFGSYLKLRQDPYEQLLVMDEWNEEELIHFLHSNHN